MHSTQPVHRNGLATPPCQHTHDKLQEKQDRQMKPKKGAGAQLYSTNTRCAFINYTTRSMSSDRFQKEKKLHGINIRCVYKNTTQCISSNSF